VPVHPIKSATYRELVEILEASSPGAIFVQHENLSGREPAERAVGIVQPVIQDQVLQIFEQTVMIEFARIRADVVLHAVFLRAIGVALDLADGGALVGHRKRRGGFVRLTGRPVHRHHPQVTLVLVIRGVHYVVALAHSVEEEPVEYTRFVIADCASAFKTLCSITLED